LDGTPGTFARVFADYIDLPVKRLFVTKAKKPHDSECVICDKPGGEYTIYLDYIDVDTETEQEVECALSWAVHEEHFESSIGDG
jgi:hypothetical protein